MSSSDVVIRVEGLGKRYALHHEKAERYTALRDVVAQQAMAAGRLLNPFTLAGQLRKAQREAAAERAESEEEFWALKDVSFEIRRGERVGIIGRNGAGKSTLLKILSRITEPTTGRVEIRGRVASLLEVGTGFHPELTGRENIYLNGAILGMKRREIRAKFDEIVDFSEVSRFLDTPVKRYSSGMYVRLAFAVAAHLEPEILVIDEVLAVGDTAFQRKCIAKVEGASVDGKTTLFVSHNMATIEQITDRSLYLDKGRLAFLGSTSAAIREYASTSGNSSSICYTGSSLKRKSDSTGLARITRLRFANEKNTFRFDESIRFSLNLVSSVSADDLSISITVYTGSGKAVGSTFCKSSIQVFTEKPYTYSVELENPRLAPGNYYFGVAVGKGNNKNGYLSYDVVKEVLHFSVLHQLCDDGSLVNWSHSWGDIVFNPLDVKEVIA